MDLLPPKLMLMRQLKIRKQKATQQFLYEGSQETQSSPEEHFKRAFFLHLLGTAFSSLNERFSNFQMFIIFMVFSSLKRPHQTVFRVAHLQTSVLNWKKYYITQILRIWFQRSGLPTILFLIMHLPTQERCLITLIRNSFQISMGSSAYSSICF